MPILPNPPGVCDFIAPRPVMQNGVWYVYVQGTENCTLEQSRANAAIYVAAGVSLDRRWAELDHGTGKPGQSQTRASYKSAARVSR